MAELEVPVHPNCIKEIQADPEKARTLARCQVDFLEFLKYWRYLNQETGEIEGLGEGLWESQEQFAEAMIYQKRIFILKARKLGATTIECAWDAWVARFRDGNARVHLYSRREDAARELLEAVKFGLDRLPLWMRLPYDKKPTTLELILRAGPDDKRRVKSYPTSEETSVEATCTHSHIDELARMRNPRLVWQAIEPSIAGTAHIITTGRGPTNFASILYRKCLSGDSNFTPIFVDALARPDRDETWLATKRKGTTLEHFHQEFPMTYQHAMSGGGKFLFRSHDVDYAGTGEGSKEPEAGHRYVSAWDIGRHHDAAVGITLDTSVDPVEVVDYVRLRGVPYPVTQRRIEEVEDRYRPRVLAIEANGPGEAVAENLDIPEHRITLFKTTGKSKVRILEELQLLLEQRGIRWSAVEWPQLDEEVRGYQVPDESIVQDSVMSLAIGIDYINQAVGRTGKVMRPIRIPG
jgi:hypothetical protein